MRHAASFIVLVFSGFLTQKAQTHGNGTYFNPSAGILTIAADISTVINVANGFELRQALEAVAKTDRNVVALFRNDIRLDGAFWNDSSPIEIPPGRIAVLRSQLDAIPDFSTSPNAVRHAGAKSLNFDKKAGLINVHGGDGTHHPGTIVFDGLYITNGPLQPSYRKQNPDVEYPWGVSVWPAVLLQPDGTVGHNYTMVDYSELDNDCSEQRMQDNASTARTLLDNITAAGVLGSTWYTTGGTLVVLPMHDARTNLATGRTVQVFFNNVARKCVFDEGLDLHRETLSAITWALIGSAIFAIAAILCGFVFVFTRRRSRRLVVANQQPYVDADRPTKSSVVAIHAEMNTLSMTGKTSKSHANSKADSSAAAAVFRHLDVGAIQQLRNAWENRIGQAHGLEFHGIIGRGDYGRVFKAKWSGIFVAAKLVEHAVTSRLTKEIQREAALATSLAHPHIITTFKVCTVGLDDLDSLPRIVSITRQPSAEGGASGEAPSSIVAASSESTEISTLLPDGIHMVATIVVMELADLGSLTIALKRGVFYVPDADRRNDMISHSARTRAVVNFMVDVNDAPIYRPRDALLVLQVLADVAVGLDFLHSACNIIHGDVSPDNIFLVQAGNTTRGWVAKLGGFGVARVLDGGQPARLTACGAKPHRMVPEQFTATPVLRPQADCYAFGLLMWQLWTNKAPFQSDRELPLDDFINTVCHQGKRPTIPYDMPAKYAGLLCRCWSQIPDERPSMTTVLSEVRAMLVEARKKQGLAACHRLLTTMQQQPSSD